jgi:hypothetical protein
MATFMDARSGVYSVEVKHADQWRPIADARSMQQAILRARSLFRQGETGEVRIVNKTDPGRRRVHAVERMTDRPGMIESALRRVGWARGDGAATTGPDVFATRYGSDAYRMALVVGLGVALGTLCLICVQIAALVGRLGV